MREELITFETAELASELGFTIGFGNGKKYYYPQSEELTENHRGNNYPAPTQSLLQKWLREKHKINIHVSEYTQNSYISFVSKRVSRTHVMKIDANSNTGYTYEEALEKALYRALNLVIQLKDEHR